MHHALRRNVFKEDIVYESSMLTHDIPRTFYTIFHMLAGNLRHIIPFSHWILAKSKDSDKILQDEYLKGISIMLPIPNYITTKWYELNVTLMATPT